MGLIISLILIGLLILSIVMTFVFIDIFESVWKGILLGFLTLIITYILLFVSVLGSFGLFLWTLQEKSMILDLTISEGTRNQLSTVLDYASVELVDYMLQFIFDEGLHSYEYYLVEGPTDNVKIEINFTDEVQEAAIEYFLHHYANYICSSNFEVITFEEVLKNCFTHAFYTLCEEINACGFIKRECCASMLHQPVMVGAK